MSTDIPPSDAAQTTAAPSVSPIAPAAARQAATIGELLTSITTGVSTLIRGEIELTKTKALTFVSLIKVGAIALGIAGFLALYGFGWALHSAELALALVMPAWAAALCVTGGLFLIVAIAAIFGITKLKASREHTPDPQAGFTQDVEAVKKGLDK